MKRLQTTPPDHHVPVILYDGACRLCTSQAKNLAKLSKGKVLSRALQTELKNFPTLSETEALKEIKLIDAQGYVYGGAEAIVKLINYGQPILGKLLYPYYIPGIRQLANKTYAWVARNRYRLFGTVPEDACENDACSVHFNLPKH
jgi:predicted DCC family thiol-disulfide oxidoreductase YuxK